MAERNINNSALRTALINGDPFEYAHLVKFERPFASKNGEFRTNANRYVYLTDGQRDLTQRDSWKVLVHYRGYCALQMIACPSGTQHCDRSHVPAK